jgi:hypothetical protein
VIDGERDRVRGEKLRRMKRLKSASAAVILEIHLFERLAGASAPA